MYQTTLPAPARSWVLTLALTAASLLIGAPADAADPGEPEPKAEAEQAETSDYSPYFTGAFVEYALRGGASLATKAPYDGWHLDVGVRHSFPMLIGDLRLAYRFDRLTPTDESTPGAIDQHGLGAYLAIHPGYLLLLGNDWLSYTLASVFVELGAGARASVLERADDGSYETGFGPFTSLGAGVDMPLWDPDGGHAPWLNLVYRWHIADFDGARETYDIDMHVLQVGVGWRINGLLF